ncbi:acetylcholinesterase-like [Limulus polyphemus]|uniref:acetylcholinesterase n=1 Tax=Limulus polyphemus TaxID=6850 RepID=A0ABM1BVV4_LIMPO|nr:acetylcholinesterase-like [Limulus polyphemus]
MASCRSTVLIFEQLLLALFLWSAWAENIEVTTKSGVVEGIEHPVIIGEGVYVFNGIPYAKPPVGDLRFAKPVPIGSWEGKVGGEAKPNSCYQTNIHHNQEVHELWKLKVPLSEDCLYLNIYVPQNSTLGFGIDNPQPEDLIPVMVFIHGGKFHYGSASLDAYDGTVLAAATDVIVVTINYRLGPMGFLHLSNDGAPGNQGLMDQQTALRWVKENIHAFGGNPENITLFGEGSGSVCVGLHTMMEESKGLFHHAIMESMSPLFPHSSHNLEETNEVTELFAEKTGCTSKDPGEILSCLRGMEPEKLIATTEEIIHEGHEMPFVPTYGPNSMISKSPFELAEEGHFNNVVILIGTNQDEGSRALEHYIPENKEEITREEAIEVVQKVIYNKNPGTAKKIVEHYMNDIDPSNTKGNLHALKDAFGDYFYTCPCLYFTENFSKSGKHAYYYFLNFIPKRYHQAELISQGDEVEFVFGLPFQKIALEEYASSERDLSLRVMSHFATFAERGNPSLALNEWPAFHEGWPVYQELNTLTPNFAYIYNQMHCQFWRDIVGEQH